MGFFSSWQNLRKGTHLDRNQHRMEMHNPHREKKFSRRTPTPMHSIEFVLCAFFA